MKRSVREYADILESEYADSGYCGECPEHLDSGRCMCNVEDDDGQPYMTASAFREWEKLRDGGAFPAWSDWVAARKRDFDKLKT